MQDERVAVVVLTQGSRPHELAAALDSVLTQRGVCTDIVVVGNGWRPVDLPPGVRGVHLPINLGIPAGRNAGADQVAGDCLLFLDDDARLCGPNFLRTMLRMLDAEPRLGLVQPRVDATDGSAPRRWIPRLRKGDPRRSTPVFSCWEGAVVVRRAAFDAAGRWAGEFGYAHEGIDLAFRLWDAGYRVVYAGDVAALHPPIDPRRHPEFDINNARNRVWIARRNLRWPLSWTYVATWTFVQIVRTLHAGELDALRPWLRGWWTGWRTDPGTRRPMRWSTVWTMTRHGRPPIV